MIKIDNYFAKKPEAYQKALEKYGIPKNKSAINVEVWKAAKPKLLEIFNKKCAFCENTTKGAAPKDVEHFRPKRAVEGTSHGGYYWLAHEWSNFLLSCQVCNRSHKKNHFPIAGPRVEKLPQGDIVSIEDAIYLAENALLLHPVLDNVEDALKFLPNGKVKGLNEKGEKSVEHFGLNRPDLIDLRRAISFDIQDDILALYERNEPPNEKKMRDELERIIVKLVRTVDNCKETFRAFRAAILEDFISFIIEEKIILEQSEMFMFIPQQEKWKSIAKELLDS